MNTFVLLYLGGSIPESEEAQAESQAAWGAWFEKMGEAIVDGGKPFNNAKTVTKTGTIDGAGTSPAVTGYTVISAKSLDDAVAKVQDHPHIKHGGEVIVHETFEM